MGVRDDGKAAFPQLGYGQRAPEVGISMRDYFAAKALEGMLACPGDQLRGSHHNNNNYEGVANMAYAYADAMLKERAK